MKKIIKKVIKIFGQKPGFVIYDILSKYNIIFKATYNKSFILLIILFYKLIFSEFLLKKKTKKFNEKNFQNYYGKNCTFNYNDWFSGNIPIWDFFLKKYNLFNKKLNYLEIGSFEGRSSVFILENLKNSRCQSVDTFSGSDEHSKINFSKVFENFKKNVEPYKNRININKINSNNFFQRNELYFDLIYVDGSHYAKDVYADAINSFKFLNKNGLIIFDDFVWTYYDTINNNPIGGLIPFLKENLYNIKIIYVNFQLIVQKI